MAARSLQDLVPFEIAPKNAARFAARIVETLWEVEKVKLNYSVASIKTVDQVLDDYSQHKEVTPRRIAVTLFELGCYVGEVIVRHNPGARWTTLGDEETESSLNSGLVVELATGTVVNPIGKVEKRLVNGDGDDLPHFYQMVRTIDDEPD
jgi:hypothetical protein